MLLMKKLVVEDVAVDRAFVHDPQCLGFNLQYPNCHWLYMPIMYIGAEAGAEQEQSRSKPKAGRRREAQFRRDETEFSQEGRG